MSAQVSPLARYVLPNGHLTPLGLELIASLIREIAELRARLEALEP